MGNNNFMHPHTSILKDTTQTVIAPYNKVYRKFFHIPYQKIPQPKYSCQSHIHEKATEVFTDSVTLQPGHHRISTHYIKPNSRMPIFTHSLVNHKESLKAIYSLWKRTHIPSSLMIRFIGVRLQLSVSQFMRIQQKFCNPGRLLYFRPNDVPSSTSCDRFNLWEYWNSCQFAVSLIC